MDKASVCETEDRRFESYLARQYASDGKWAKSTVCKTAVSGYGSSNLSTRTKLLTRKNNYAAIKTNAISN